MRIKKGRVPNVGINHIFLFELLQLPVKYRTRLPKLPFYSIKISQTLHLKKGGRPFKNRNMKAVFIG